MNGKMRIVLLLTLYFTLFGTLPAIAAADPAPPSAAPMVQQTTAPRKPKAASAPSTRNAPSFACAKASNAVERVVCADPVLAELDVGVAAEYKKALSLVADKAALRTNQRQWLRQMHSQCAKVGSQCIQHYYKTRLSQLQQHNEQAAQIR